MTTTAIAIYENGVLRPLSRLSLMEGAEVEVKITPVEGVSQITGGRTGAELARIWAALPHLSAEEAAMFENDLAQARAAEGGQPAPAWE